jgi:hypothetical protein
MTHNGMLADKIALVTGAHPMNDQGLSWLATRRTLSP